MNQYEKQNDIYGKNLLLEAGFETHSETGAVEYFQIYEKERVERERLEEER